MSDRRADDPTNDDTPGGHTGTITVFGGSSAGKHSATCTFAYELGRRLAEAGFELVNGGYGGTMEAASRGAKDAGGKTIGVTLPSAPWAGRSRLKPNSFLDEVHPAPDLPSRIDAMIRMSGGFVVLDGGTGTLAELGAAWEYVTKGLVPPRPIVVAGRCWDGLIDAMAAHRASSARCLHRAENAAQAVDILIEHAVTGTRARPRDANASLYNDESATVAQLRALMDRFVEQRRWQPFHDPKNLSASIAIEAAELMEHFQWLRSDQLDDVRNNPDHMQAVREELADVLAYVLSFASTMEIDLASALADKMRKNARKYPVDRFRGRFR